jgi:hypothetical protein
VPFQLDEEKSGPPAAEKEEESLRPDNRGFVEQKMPTAITQGRGKKVFIFRSKIFNKMSNYFKFIPGIHLRNPRRGKNIQL